MFVCVACVCLCGLCCVCCDSAGITAAIKSSTDTYLGILLNYKDIFIVCASFSSNIIFNSFCGNLFQCVIHLG